MSSMRNAVQRRNHKERAQPTERSRLGLLEKKKDYSARAKDYNKKKQQLKNLREKAAERNEDEFYFGMMSRKGTGSRLQNGKRWTGTIEGDRGNKVLDLDTVRLLKTQDMGYVRTMKNVIMKEVARLEQQVVMTRGLDHLDADEDEDDFDFDEEEEDAMPRFSKPKAPRKIQFLDTEEEQEAIAEQADNDDMEDEDEEVDEAKEEENTKREKSARSLQKRLNNARKKLAALAAAEQALEEQRAKMAKTATSFGKTRRGKKIMVRTRKR